MSVFVCVEDDINLRREELWGNTLCVCIFDRLISIQRLQLCVHCLWLALVQLLRVFVISCAYVSLIWLFWCVTVRATVGNFIVECGVFLFSLFLFSDFKRLHLIYYNQVLPNLLPLPLPIVCAFAFAFAFAFVYWFLPLALFVSPLCCPHQQSQTAYPSSGLVDTFKSKTAQVLTKTQRECSLLGHSRFN